MISGVLAHVEPQRVVVDVGGVGYLIHTTSTESTGRVGQAVSFHTYLAVRETALDLYGFSDIRARETFELLLTIPKIGPKSALQVLEAASVSLLQEAVQLQDAGHLSKLSGIGKKTAENIVLGLKDKLEVTIGDQTRTALPQSAAVQDAFDALLALGYTAPDIRTALEKAPEDTDAQALVRFGLRELA